jgi:hypothetical protein
MENETVASDAVVLLNKAIAEGNQDDCIRVKICNMM